MLRRWVKISGCERYSVSDDGLVFSTISSAIKKSYVDNRGYLRVQVYDSDKQITYKVHRLVAHAFVPNKKKLPQVNHIDGNKQNNHYTNLEWVTHRQNADHAIANDLYYRRRDLDNHLPYIKAAYIDGYYLVDIAKEHSVSYKTLTKLIANIQPDYSYGSRYSRCRRKKGYYFDNARQMYRTEVKGAKSKQFKTEKECQKYVKEQRRRQNAKQTLQ